MEPTHSLLRQPGNKQTIRLHIFPVGNKPALHLPAMSPQQPLDFTPLAELVDAAKADSLWQLLVLQGATAGSTELLAYAAPTYYGMAVAIVG